MPRPGGNPEFGTKYGFKTDREEALTELLAVRVSASMKSELKNRDNWQEFVRKAIAKALSEKKEQMDATSAGC